MARERTFADKLNKSKKVGGGKCNVCGTEYSNLLLVTSEKSLDTNSWKFNRKQAKVCKCNHKEVYG